MKRFALLVLAAGTMLFAAGCGSDDDAGGTLTDATSDAPSKAEFVQEANQICEDGGVTDEQAAELGTSPSPEEIEAFVTDVVIPQTQEQIDTLRDLQPPEGDEDEVNAILDAAQDGLDTVKDDPSAISTDAFDEANRLSTDYGLDVCAS